MNVTSAPSPLPRRQRRPSPRPRGRCASLDDVPAADGYRDRLSHVRWRLSVLSTPGMEAWQRQLNDPVSAFPIAKAGPAHIATLKTYDPPLQALEGRRLEGVERRAKRLPVPTDDEELVVLFHLMTAGRLKLLRAGEKGPKTPSVSARSSRGSARAHRGRREEAGRRLAALPGAGRGGNSCIWVPEAYGIGAERLAEICADESRRLHSMLRDQRVIARIGPRVGERDPPPRRAFAVRADQGPRRRGDRPPRGGDRRRARARPRAARARGERQEDVPRAQQAGRALPRVRNPDRARGLRETHDLLLPHLPDRGPDPQGPTPLPALALVERLPMATALPSGSAATAASSRSVVDYGVNELKLTRMSPPPPRVRTYARSIKSIRASRCSGTSSKGPSPGSQTHNLHGVTIGVDEALDPEHPARREEPGDHRVDRLTTDGEAQSEHRRLGRGKTDDRLPIGAQPDRGDALGRHAR